MSFRCFKRVTWQHARSTGWPDDLEPLATPMDTCRTLAEFDTVEEAREWCAEHNQQRPYSGKLVDGSPAAHTLKQRQTAALAAYAEFTEI